MRIATLLCTLWLLVSCASLPDLSLAPNTMQKKACDDRMHLLGPGWAPSEVPREVERIVESVRFSVVPRGLTWYTRNDSDVAACAFTNDSNGCGFSGHVFQQRDGLWFHATAWTQDEICVLE